MRHSPPRLLILSLLAAPWALPGHGAAQDAPDSALVEPGGWGQAWGDDDRLPQPTPTRRSPPPRAPIAPIIGQLPALAPVTPPPVRPAPAGISAAPLDETGSQPYPEVGGWGQAWGEDDPLAQAPPRAAMPSTLTPQQPPTPARTAPVKAASPRGPDPVIAAVSAPAPATPGTATVPAGPLPARQRPATVAAADGDGDAVGLRRPPRIIPRAVVKMREQQDGSLPPVQMEADQVLYDRDYSVVTAKGRVEMIQSGRTITADTVSYNLKQDVMGASGHVMLTEPSGEVTFADYFEITGDFKAGVATNLRMILADNSRLAALSAQRVGGDRTDLDKGVYTACEPCRDDPDATPIWQAKAERVTHNQAEGQIEYRDAWIELAGIPVLYTPYLSHPDPSVKRKSGLLAPTLGYNSTLGPSIALPYYFVVSDNEDVTIVPRLMRPKTNAASVFHSDPDDLATSAMQHLHLLAEHRWRGVYGETKTQGSITADKSTGEIRGHVESKGLVELDRTWRMGWQAQYQSDNAYRYLYRVRTDNDRPWRLTRPYVEGFGRRNYAMAETMTFQGPRVVADSNKSTVVAPHLVHRAVSEPGWGGSYWSFDSDLLFYTRGRGTVAQRLSQTSSWNLPLTTPDGQLVNLVASMRGDGYRADHVIGHSGDVTSGRVVPEVSMTWRYPFARPGETVSQVIEPMAMVAVAPVGGNSDRIPNEDSLAFELDETNVMRPNRLVGLDRVEGGLRGGYGLRYSAFPARGGRLGVQVAQGWRRHLDDTFSPTSGFTDTLSDYVGRVDIQPNGALTLTERVRLDKSTLSMRRNESMIAVGPPPLTASVAYGYMSTTTGETGQVYPRRQYISYALNSFVSQYWRFQATLNQDLDKNGEALNWSVAAVYSDECFAVGATLNRYHSDVTGLLSGYNAMLTVALKTLGEAPFGLF